METSESSVCFLAVDHSGSFHYFSIICRKHGEQVRKLALHQNNMQGLNDNIQWLHNKECSFRQRPTSFFKKILFCDRQPIRFALVIQIKVQVHELQNFKL